ncbi:hypothetical protein KAI92_00110 [Candidatus Parcubacteria bacterium]|nr:hypothetical protein [Candidatus Parcubacteria bacterium]
MQKKEVEKIFSLLRKKTTEFKERAHNLKVETRLILKRTRSKSLALWKIRMLENKTAILEKEMNETAEEFFKMLAKLKKKNK